jgi:hypothetical protein
MSTSYYWTHNIPREVERKIGGTKEYSFDDMDPFIHIGKLTGGTRFVWAQDPTFVEMACKSNMDAKVIYNEYWEEFTGREFLELIEGLEDKLLIGQWFG